MKDYLGKVSLTLDDIRKLSNSDQSHWFPLKETKTGSIELKIKVLSEECEVTFTQVTSAFCNFLSTYKSRLEIICSRHKARMQPAISATILLVSTPSLTPCRVSCEGLPWKDLKYVYIWIQLYRHHLHHVLSPF